MPNGHHTHDSLHVHDLIRLFDLIFLNAQMCQFNSSGNPYSSPIVWDKENEIVQCVDTLCIEESDEMCAWTLLKMVIWSLSLISRRLNSCLQIGK